MNDSLKKGMVIEFDYPTANYAHVRRRLERRVAVVVDVRDLAERPLHPITTVADPNLHRGARLVATFDLQKQAERSFYFERMENITIVKQEVPPLEQWSVLWIECDESWSPMAPELPDEFTIKDWLAKGVAESIADIIAAGANSLAMRTGSVGRWAWACPPGYLSQFEQSP